MGVARPGWAVGAADAGCSDRETLGPWIGLPARCPQTRTVRAPRAVSCGSSPRCWRSRSQMLGETIATRSGGSRTTGAALPWAGGTTATSARCSGSIQRGAALRSPPVRSGAVVGVRWPARDVWRCGRRDGRRRRWPMQGVRSGSPRRRPGPPCTPVAGSRAERVVPVDVKLRPRNQILNRPGETVRQGLMSLIGKLAGYPI